MLALLAQRQREEIHNYLADDKEERAERNVAQRPSIVQGAHDQQDLGKCVDHKGRAIHDEIDDPQCGWRRVTEWTQVVERRHRNDSYHQEHHK